MLVVGLTGGIGSGKSQASQWFEAQGITVVDADVVSREVVEKGSPTLAKIVAKFGDWVLDSQGELNRRALREQVFAHPQALIDLEQITHPAIRQRVKDLLAESTSPYTLLVAPLLLEGSEAGLVQLCQRILVVDTTPELQLQRASSRDGQTQANIAHIMANQLSREARLARADDIVTNTGSLAELYIQLETLHQQYLTMAT